MEEQNGDAPTPRPEDAPDPAAVGHAKRDRPTPEGDDLDPTRYGDWEMNGRCIDF